MVLISGNETKLAFEQAVVWETPVVCAGDAVQPILSEDLSSDIELVEDLSLGGVPVQPLGGRGNETSEGTAPFNASYDGRWITWLCMILGEYDEAANAVNPGFHDHLITVKSSVAGKFGTLCVAHGSFDVFEYANSKPSEVEFSTTGTAPLLEGSQTFINRVRNRDSIVNTPATMATTTPISVLPPIEYLLAAFSHLEVLLRNSLDTLYTEVCVSELTFRIARPQEGDFTTCLDGTISEPVSVDFVECSGSFVIPNYGDDAVLQDLLDLNDSKAARALVIKFTSPNTYDPGAVGPLPLSMEFVFPSTQFTTVGPNASGVGKMPVEVAFFGKRKAVPSAVVFDAAGVAIPTVNGATAEGVFVRIVNGYLLPYMV